MIKISRFFYVHILLLPLILVAFVTKSQMTFFISYGIVLIHELSHLLTAILLNVPVYSIIVMPFGMTIRLSTSLMKHPKKEALIALSGPFANVCMLVIGMFFYDRTPSLNFMLFLVINICMLLLNLIPVPPLDGGRILRTLITHRAGLIPAVKIMRRISYFFIGCILLCGIFLLVFFQGNPSLVMIAAFLLYNLADEKKNSDILIMRELIYQKETQKENALIPSKTLCILDNTPAKYILKKLNLSTFYMISVLDDEMRLLKTVTESDVIRTVTAYGYNVRAIDVINFSKQNDVQKRKQ